MILEGYRRGRVEVAWEPQFRRSGRPDDRPGAGREAGDRFRSRLHPERAGHGRFSALNLADAGATVACIDIDEGRAHGIVAEIEAAGGKAFPVIADMTDRPGATGGRRGRGRAWAASTSASTSSAGPVGQGEDFTDDDWAWTIQNNLTQVFYLFQEVGRQMIGQGTAARSSPWPRSTASPRPPSTSPTARPRRA